MAADCVDFVDEDDAGSVLLALFEEIANAAGADADEHFDEVRAGNGEEWHVSFAGNSAGEQGLAGAWRSDKEHALGDAATKLLEALGLAEIFDDLLKLFLGLIDAGDILEGDLLLLHGEQAGAALAEGHGLVAAGLHLAHDEEPDSQNQDQRADLIEDGPEHVARSVLDGGLHLGGVELGVHVRIVHGNGGVEASLLLAIVFVVAVDVHPGHSDVIDLILLNLFEEGGEGHVLLFATHDCAFLHHSKEEHEADHDESPEHDCFYGRVHQDSFVWPRECCVGDSRTTCLLVRRRSTPERVKKVGSEPSDEKRCNLPRVSSRLIVLPRT